MEIKDIVKSAYENVPFYNYLYNKSKINIAKYKFDSLPVCTKDDIRNYGVLNFTNKQYLDEEYKYDKSNIVVTSSSGTTGEPMDTLWSKQEYLSSMRIHWLFRYRNYNVTPQDKFLTTAYYNDRKDVVKIKNNRKMIINTALFNEENLKLIIENINIFKPRWLLIPASVLYLLVEFSIHNNLTFPESIEYIEYFSEEALPYYRQVIDEYLHIPSTQMYGCTECNGIAYECQDHNLHIMDKNVHVEVLKKYGLFTYRSKREGNICITSLQNTVMPKIRYMLHDKGYISDEICSCGNNSPIIHLLQTRLPEYLIFDNEEYCGFGKMFYPIDKIGFIKQEEGDIRFHIMINRNGQYDIIIDSTTCRNKSKKLIEKHFKLIMNSYGIKLNNYHIYFSKNKNRLFQGILRLNYKC